MGAISGRGLLSRGRRQHRVSLRTGGESGFPVLGFVTMTRSEVPPTASWTDVEWFRVRDRRTVVVRAVTGPTIVLGSSQSRGIVDEDRRQALGVEVVRRRSGGGAVWLAPGDPIWIDLWLPRHDHLWMDDVIGAPGWLGTAWASALGALGAPSLDVHHGPSSPRRWSDLVCFAGVGPGEVLTAGRKVVGIAQWRSRQGALFSSACYERWHPGDLVGVLAVGPDGPEPDYLGTDDLGPDHLGPDDLGPDDLEPDSLGSAAADLAAAAIGLSEILPGRRSSRDLVQALVDHLPQGATWDVVVEGTEPPGPV